MRTFETLFPPFHWCEYWSCSPPISRGAQGHSLRVSVSRCMPQSKGSLGGPSQTWLEQVEEQGKHQLEKETTAHTCPLILGCLVLSLSSSKVLVMRLPSWSRDIMLSMKGAQVGSLIRKLDPTCCNYSHAQTKDLHAS